MTIALFVGSDEVWREFENHWNEILNNNHPPATYLHMKEVSSGSGSFHWKNGWNLKKGFDLAAKCIMYLSQMNKDHIRMFYSIVDLEAWRKLKSEGYDLRDPVVMCADFCITTIMKWRSLNPSSEGFHFFFDRGELFTEPFRKMWNAGKDEYEKTGNDNPWAWIDEISEVDMKTVPGVQSADLLAWSVNRENSGTAPGNLYAEILKQVVPHSYLVWDEQRLRKQFPRAHSPVTAPKP